MLQQTFLLWVFFHRPLGMPWGLASPARLRRVKILPSTVLFFMYFTSEKTAFFYCNAQKKAIKCS